MNSIKRFISIFLKILFLIGIILLLILGGGWLFALVFILNIVLIVIAILFATTSI